MTAIPCRRVRKLRRGLAALCMSATATMVATGLAAGSGLSVVQAAELAGVSLPDTTTVKEQKLVLNGIGLREVEFVGFDVYVAGLYVAEKGRDAQQILQSSTPKQLVLKFLRDVEVAEIHEDLEEGFANHGHSGESLRTELEKFKEFMTDVETGQQLTLTFHSDRLEVTRADGKTAEFKNPDFSRAVLEVWIGEKAQKTELKRRLLG